MQGIRLEVQINHQRMVITYISCDILNDMSSIKYTVYYAM